MIKSIKNNVVKLQALPEKKRKIIFFVVMGIITAMMLVAAIAFTIKSTKKVSSSIEPFDFSSLRGQFNDSFEDLQGQGENYQDVSY